MGAYSLGRSIRLWASSEWFKTVNQETTDYLECNHYQR
jgi:hypothetical protein